VADLTTRIPLASVTLAEIRARVDADANAGLDPDDERFIDTTIGGFYWDLTQPLLLEIARLWDFASSEVPASIYVAYSWGENLDDHGETINVPRKDAAYATGQVTFKGEEGTLIGIGTQVGTAQTDPDEDPPSYRTTESGTIGASKELKLAIKAEDAGTAANVAAGAAEFLLSPIEGVESVENLEAITGGADVETDSSYRARLLLELGAAQGAGNVADYKRWALAYPGVGFVTVVPLWAGAGTVLVVITDEENNPVSGTVVTGLQNELDPTPGKGEGKAPVGAVVTVSTPTSKTVNVEAKVELEAGYSLDGTGGTIAVRADLERVFSEYIDRLAPGDDVLIQKAESRVFLVEGIHDFVFVKLNGAASTVAVGSSEVASLGTVTLTT
jgi:uncharacterized phage protein gp47/JayE